MTATGTRGPRVDTMPRETTLYLQLCSHIQQKQNNGNTLFKDREEVPSNPIIHRMNGECSYNREVTHLQQDQSYNQHRPCVIPGLIILTLLRTVLDMPLLMLRLFHK